MDPRIARALGLAGALALALASATLLDADPATAAATAVVWATGALLAVRHAGLGDAGGWETGRWSGLFGGVVAFAGTLGVSPALPLPPGPRLALALLVVGLGFAALQIGVGMALDAEYARVRGREGRSRQ